MSGSTPRPRLGVPLAVLLALLLTGAAAAEEWFDAYEKGLEALARGQPARAAELLERAARLRPEPGQNLLTYGTNRLERYQPYLMLAEAYLANGQLDQARETLRRSEQHAGEPATARARLAVRLEQALAARPPAPTAAPPAVAVAPPPAPPAPLISAAPPPAATPRPAPPEPAASAAAPALLGTLDLRSDPPGATVLVGNRLAGATPLTLQLPPGSYEVTLRKEGTAEQRFAVRILAGERSSESRALVPTAAPPSAAPLEPPAVAALIVYSQPGGALVYLDDEAIGTTDALSGRLVKSGVAPGAHVLRLAAAGHAERTQSITVAPDGPTTVPVALEAHPVASRLTSLPLLASSGLALAALAFLVSRRWGRRAVPGTAGPAMPTAPQATALPAATVGMTPPAVTRPAPEAATAATATGLLERRAESGSLGSFGEFSLVEQLGKGGMAVVYRALRRGEQVALKRPLPAYLEEPEFIQRFEREAEIGRTLHHPNIIRIFEHGSVGRVPYFTMELVEGETLQAHLRRHGRLDGRAATHLVTQVAEALDYAHLKGVVHRDLKPSNIMLLQGGQVKVMDYGIARARRFEGLTMTGTFLGTPDYIAPETAEGHGTDARSDLYALGVVFYEMLAGRRPFQGETPFATLRQHCSEPPPPLSITAPDCPAELAEVVLRLLAKRPDDRYPGAEELLITLRDWLNRAA